MKILLLTAVLATVSLAGILEYGPQIGYWVPTGDVGDIYEADFYFGGQVLFHLPLFAVEGSVGYVSLRQEAEPDDFTSQFVPIAAGLRSYMGPVYAAGGFELDIMDLEGTETDADIGGYIGAGFVPTISFVADIDASARLHFVSFEDMWVGITVGLNF